MSARRSDTLPPRLNLTLLLAAAAALGAVLVLARQVPYGVGLHSDSINYLGVARNLAAGVGFREPSASVYVGWPPLYPLLLAAVSFDALDPLDVAGPVNAALFGLTIFVAGQYLRRRLESRFLVVWAALTIALAAPLAGQAAVALAGAAFILLVTLTLINTDAFLARGRTSSLVWAGVCAALAWQTRYVGGALLAAVVLMLLLQRGARPVQRVRRAAGFALLAGAPMATWLVRNQLVSGTLTGPRGFGRLPAALSGVGEVLWPWAAFDLPLVDWQAAAYLGLLPTAALAVACGVLVRERWRGRRMPSDWLPCYVFGGFALTWFTAVTVSLALGVTSAVVEERYLGPLYIPLLVTAAFALDRILGFAREAPFIAALGPRWRRRAPRAAAAVVTAVLCFWTAGQIEPNAREIRRANAEGVYGYASPFWAQSAILEWIHRNQPEGLIFSNEPVAASLHNYSPSEGYHYLPAGKEDKQELLQRWRANGVTFYVVWFDDERFSRHHDYGIAVLRASPDLELVAELVDGAIFKVIGLPDTE